MCFLLKILVNKKNKMKKIKKEKNNYRNNKLNIKKN